MFTLSIIDIDSGRFTARPADDIYGIELIDCLMQVFNRLDLAIIDIVPDGVHASPANKGGWYAIVTPRDNLPYRKRTDGAVPLVIQDQEKSS